MSGFLFFQVFGGVASLRTNKEYDAYVVLCHALSSPIRPPYLLPPRQLRHLDHLIDGNCRRPAFRRQRLQREIGQPDHLADIALRVDLSRIYATLIARSGCLAFEGQRAFASQR